MANHIKDIQHASAYIKKHVDLLNVVSDDLGPPKDKPGNDHLWLCPFHSEFTPSFGVHKEMQFYHCFGCKVGGDAVKWVQNYHSMSAENAIRYLAVKYGVDISVFERPPTPEEVETERNYLIMGKAAEFCSDQLFANKSMLDWYVKDTGFDMGKIADYEVGFCPTQDAIINHLFTAIPGLSQSDVDKLEFSNRMMWNNAIVYPVKTADGQVARFHNKPLTPPDGFGGKYVGTSHKHPLFSNGLLFGFSLVKKNLKKGVHSIRIVEGQKAAIASDGAALMGSSVHEDQIKMLKANGIKEVRFLFDGDFAGRQASDKLLEISGQFDDIHVLVGRIHEGKQPDDVVKESGQAALDDIFAKAGLPIQYFIDGKRDINGQLSTTDKFVVVKELKDHLVNLSDIQLDLTASYLAQELQVDVNSVKMYVLDLKQVKNGLFNRDIELSVLQYVLNNPRYWSSLRQQISDAKTFTTTANQWVFTALEAAHKKARDIIGPESVTIQVVKDELALLYPQYKELPAVIDSILTTESKYEFNDAISKITDLYRRRMGIEQSRLFIGYLNDLNKTTPEIVSGFRRQLVSSVESRPDEGATPDLLAVKLANELQERSMRKSEIIGYDFSCIVDVDGRKIPTMTGLTMALSGLQKQHQVVISANSGVGKSIAALQMATSISVCPAPADRVPSLWIALEMNAIETTMRMVSMLSGVDNNLVQKMNLNEHQTARVNKAVDMIGQGRFYIKKPKSGTIDEIFSIIDEYHFKYGIGAVFLDYIQLISSAPSDKGFSREEVIGRASKVLKNQVAETLGIASVCIAQQNRSDYKAGETGSIQNIGGSYQIAQDADDFLILAEKTQAQIDEEKTSKGNRKIFIDKRRGGASDIMIDAYLDTAQHCNLRFVETLTPQELLNLSRGGKA